MPEKDKTKKFTYTLQPRVRLDNKEWNYHVPRLPGPRELNRLGLVKKITLRTDMKNWKHEMLLGLEHIDLNRAISQDPLDRFVVISFENFRPLAQRGAGAPDGAVSGLEPETFRDCTEYAVRLLRTGVSLQGIRYHFYGHSNSQLRSRTCFLFAASTADISSKVEALGDFAKMKTVGKKAKRIGLLFSVARTATTVPPDRCEDIPDIETSDYVFTDGCGLIAPELARDLARRVRIVFRDRRYTPSVFQIRYRGYKGVVTVDPRMAKGKSLLRLRKSMKKFSGVEDHSFAVVAYSKVQRRAFRPSTVVALLGRMEAN